MQALHAIILGIVEGATEFLPVSSTAHLIISSRLLGLAQSEFVKSFEIAIQLGAILAVVVLYRQSFLRDRATLLRIIAAFIPTAIVGFLLHKVIKEVLFESLPVILWSLVIGGVVIIAFELLHKEKTDAATDIGTIPYPKAIAIGIAQSLAVVPGVSRAAATVLGGEALGLSRRAAVDFSFLLAVPTMLAATVLDLSQAPVRFTQSEYGLLAIGFVVSFLVALVTVRWLTGFIKRHSFAPFGVYRIALALVVWIALLP